MNIEEIIASIKIYYHKPPKDSYFAKYRTEVDGEWQTKHIPVDQKTKAAAHAWLVQWLKAECIKKPVETIITIRSLVDWWYEYLDERKCSPEMLKSHEQSITNHVLTHPIADMDIELIEMPETTQFISWLKDRKTLKAPHVNLSPNSIRIIVRAVRTLFDDAEGMKRIRKGFPNPFLRPRIKYVMPKIKKKAGNVKVWIELAAFNQLIDCQEIPNFRRVRYLVAAGTGARPQEQSGWKWKDWKKVKERSFLRVERQLKRKIGKRTGHEDGDPKEEASSRDIPLQMSVQEALKWWFETGWRIFVGRAPTPEDRIFPTDEGKDNAFCSASKELIKDLRQAGLPTLYEDKLPYEYRSLRKSFLTWLELAGVSDSRRQALAGQTGETVMDAHYIGRHLETYLAEVDKLALTSLIGCNRTEQAAE